MTDKHTRGPWRWDKLEPCGNIFAEARCLEGPERQDVLSAFTDAYGSLGIDLSLADAKLIAAAPDMLSLLTQLVELDWFEDSGSMQDLVAEVIDKAEGTG